MNNYELFMQYLALSGSKANIELVRDEWFIAVMVRFEEKVVRIETGHSSLLKACEISIDKIKTEVKWQNLKNTATRENQGQIF